MIASCRHGLGAIALGAGLLAAGGTAWSQDVPPAPPAQAAAQPAPTPIPAPIPAPIPFKHDKDSTPALAGRGLAVLALAALAAYGGALALKRFGVGTTVKLGGARRVRLAESVRLSRRSVLHVVHYRGEELLLAESEHGLQLVTSRAQEANDA